VSRSVKDLVQLIFLFQPIPILVTSVQRSDVEQQIAQNDI